MTDMRPGEIPCPSCSRSLALPVEAVLSGQTIVCGACGLELTAQRQASRKALDALGSWYSETADAREAAARPAEPPHIREASCRARRPRR